MNINKFGAFISYLTALSGKHHDTYEVETIAKYVQDLIPEAPKAGMGPCEMVDELLKAMKEANGKIPAIKAYRALTGADLRTSKDAVDKYYIEFKRTDNDGAKLSDILGSK